MNRDASGKHAQDEAEDNGDDVAAVHAHLEAHESGHEPQDAEHRFLGVLGDLPPGEKTGDAPAGHQKTVEQIPFHEGLL